MKTVRLNNGIKMPILGYGTLKLPKNKCAYCVAKAIEKGWRLIDTAKNYANEREVGEGIIQSGIPRKELFVTSKLWLKDAGYKSAKAAYQMSLERLQLDYLDLYLIHQPFGDVYGSWQAMESLYMAGRIRAIGVSNFAPDRITDFAMNNKIVPAVNQIETNVYCQQLSACGVNDYFGVTVEAWSPLIQGKRQDMFENPALLKIARKHGKTVAQIVLRWLIQRDIVTLVKTEREIRMAENFNIFDFELTVDDMSEIAALDTDKTQFIDHKDPEGVKWFHQKATR